MLNGGSLLMGINVLILNVYVNWVWLSEWVRYNNIVKLRLMTWNNWFNIN